MLAFTGPPAHEVPVEQARAGHEAETEHLSGPGEPVAEVRDLGSPRRRADPRAPVPPRGGRAAAARGLPARRRLDDRLDRLLRHGRARARQRVGRARRQRRLPARARAPFPAGLEDCLCAIRWLAATRPSSAPTPRGSRSPATAPAATWRPSSRARLRGEVDLRMQPLIYPVTDAGCNTASYREFGEGYGLTPPRCSASGTTTSTAPTASTPTPRRCAPTTWPACRRRSCSPPASTPLRDEGEAYADALRDAGVEVELTPLRRRDPRLLALAGGHEALAHRGRRGRRRAARPARLSGPSDRGLWTSGQPARRYGARHGRHTDHRHVPLLAPVRRHGRGLPARAADRARGGGVGLRRRRPPLSRRHREPLVREHRPRQPEVADPVAEQMRTLEAYSTFGDFGNRRPTSCPSASPRTRRWTARGSSSPPAAATRSTPRPRSRAATGSSRASPSACT